MIIVLATFRVALAGYVSALIEVYTVIIFAYILSSLYQSFGGRVPYNRLLIGLLGWLRQVSEPFLAIFRRFIPPLGPVDLSPIVALLVLTVGGNLLAGLIRG